jgi:hypothetical protein
MIGACSGSKKYSITPLELDNIMEYSALAYLIENCNIQYQLKAQGLI